MHDHKLPFTICGAETRKAIAELESGKGKKFRSVDALMEDLHKD